MKYLIPLIGLVFLIGCKGNVSKEQKEALAEKGPTVVKTAIGPLILESPYTTESVTKRSKAINWPDGKTPIAPAGFTVTRFADGLKHPRWTYVAPNNDLFVAESNTKKSANRITLLRDTNNDGEVDERHIFKENLNQNFGMLVLDNHFYVANTDGLYRFPYTEGEKKLTGEGEKNPVGMDWNPANGELWTAVNERDKLGNNLVPDYITIVKRGGWYGWPYSYYGQINDPRWMERPHQEMVFLESSGILWL